MESRNTQTVTYQPNFANLDSIANFEYNDELTRQRLDFLVAANAETARQKLLFRSEKEDAEAATMKNPLSSIQAFSYFGLIIGFFLPLTLFTCFLFDSNGLRNEDLWILGVVAIVDIISASVGFLSGKLIGKIVHETEKYSWLQMLLMLPFIGIFWGIMAGGAGGIIIFIIGAFFGAFFGAIVGAVALPAFTIFHRLLKKGDMIDRKHFLPMAFGITFIICSFIFGL